eukprot:541008-Pleurochrysis_carterae.AAC.2
MRCACARLAGDEAEEDAVDEHLPDDEQKLEAQVARDRRVVAVLDPREEECIEYDRRAVVHERLALDECGESLGRAQLLEQRDDGNWVGRRDDGTNEPRRVEVEHAERRQVREKHDGERRQQRRHHDAREGQQHDRAELRRHQPNVDRESALKQQHRQEDEQQKVRRHVGRVHEVAQQVAPAERSFESKQREAA